MNIGPCAACKAKDTENAFLRELVRSLTEKVTNMADPLLQARLASATRVAPSVPRDTQVQTARSPALLRRIRSDRPTVDSKPGSTEDLDEAQRVLEASFSKQP